MAPAAKDSRRYPPRPILGVGALIFRGNKVLLAERAGQPMQGQWSLPGGVVEVGETLLEALHREVLEETSLRVTEARFFEVFERIMRDATGEPEYHYVLIDYLCSVAPGDARAGDDVSKCVWAARDDLARYEITAGTGEVIERAFDALAPSTTIGSL